MNNSIEIYRSQDGSVQLNVKLENETVWLTQSQMANLTRISHVQNLHIWVKTKTKCTKPLCTTSMSSSPLAIV